MHPTADTLPASRLGAADDAEALTGCAERKNAPIETIRLKHPLEQRMSEKK